MLSPPRGTHGERWALGLVLAALAVAKVVDRGVSGAHVAVGLGLLGCLLVIARAQGLAATDLGLARSTWPAGLRWGMAAATLVGAAYALAYLITPVRQALPESDGESGRAELSAYISQLANDPVTPQLTLWNVARFAFDEPSFALSLSRKRRARSAA